ncbi:MAG: LysE family transporter [Parvibaculaceae bacterium]|nr:LysE family transporter [Parvibaculaceae bacterium]HBM88933.1 lysine transporter LysE [Rhodobiaceae bacterium]|tara:strand:- start:334 stop:966 length:633 start_codon:yes stop_codon:yes gene_type:complete
MDILVLILSGLLIGVAVAAPIGPVNLICIRRTLKYGMLNGFVSGAGAAVGDGVFAIVAAFGVTAVISFVAAYSGWLQLIGGVFLLGLGVRTWFDHPHLDDKLPEGSLGDLLPVISVTFFLTITNPATMLGFIAIFGGVADFTIGTEDYMRASILVASVIGGSVLWWAAITGFVSLFRDRMTDTGLAILNKVSAVIIVLFGAGILARLLLA